MILFILYTPLDFSFFHTAARFRAVMAELRGTARQIAQVQILILLWPTCITNFQGGLKKSASDIGWKYQQPTNLSKKKVQALSRCSPCSLLEHRPAISSGFWVLTHPHGAQRQRKPLWRNNSFFLSFSLRDCRTADCVHQKQRSAHR